MAVELSSYPTLYNDANLVAYWKFEGNSNSTVGSKTGTDTNITYNASYGKFGQGALFNGSSSFISETTCNVASAITYQVWLYMTALPGTGALYQPMTQGNSAVEMFFYNNAGVQNIGFSPGAMIAYTLPLNQWFLYTITNVVGANGTKFYVNGSLVGQGTGATPPSDTGAFLFGKHPSAGRYYNGRMDEPQIYSRVLTAAEILAYYNAGNTTIKKIGGVSYANIKKISKIAIASVKKVGGKA